MTTFPEGRPGAVASDDWAQNLDELQFEEHEGPCLDAYRTGNAFRIHDAEGGDAVAVVRPPRGGARSPQHHVAADGGRGQHHRRAQPLLTRPAGLRRRGGLLGEIVAAHAGLASQVSAAFFGHRDLADQLSEAMQSRAVIEQAKGILMAVHRCDADDAFRHLVRMSQNSNRKLRDVAEETVKTASRRVPG